MKIFLDANILVSVLNKEYPLFGYTSRIISLADNIKYEVYTSAVCIAIAYYFSSKKSGNKVAKQKISLLASKIRIAPTNQQVVQESLSNPKITDLEDGIEYYSALEAGCQCIVTENLKNYYFSSIEVLNGQEFLRKYSR